MATNLGYDCNLFVRTFLAETALIVGQTKSVSYFTKQRSVSIKAHVFTCWWRDYAVDALNAVGSDVWERSLPPIV